jgi:hypothetical protein
MNITTPDGWVERPPERFEDRLFVTEKVYESGLYEGVAKEHVAVYVDDGIVEHNDSDRYHFHEKDGEKELAEAVERIMRDSQNGGSA